MIKDERGSAMLMTVIVTAVLLWVGISLLHQTVGETINTARHTDSIVVSEIALSGLEVGIALLQANNALRTNGSPLTGNVGEGSFETQIIEQDNRIRIYSTGYLSGITKTVISEVSISAGAGRYAIVADSLIGITGSVDIDGDIALNSPSGLVSLSGSSDIYGNIYIPHGDDLEAALIITGSADHHGEIAHFTPIEISPIEFPEFPVFICNGDLNIHSTYTIATDGRYDMLSVTGSGDLTIVLDGGIRSIIVREFRLTGSSDINIVGSGELRIYVEETFRMTGSTDFEEGENNSLFIFYKGSNDLSFSGSTDFSGTIVSKHSGLRLTGSSDIDGVFAVNGDIMLTGSVDFNGLLFAPNHEINIHGSADIDGSMIAQTVSMTGSSDLTSSTGYYDFLQNPLLGDSLGIGELEFTRVRN